MDAIRASVAPQTAAASLWNRLGGEANVKRVVDDFVALAAADPKVNFFRAGAFKDKVNVPAGAGAVEKVSNWISPAPVLMTCIVAVGMS